MSVAIVEKWYRLRQVAEITGFGRTKLFGFMQQGLLKSKRVGASRVIPESSLIEFQQRFDGTGEIDPDESGE